MDQTSRAFFTPKEASYGFELHDQKRSPWAGLLNGGKLLPVVVVVAELWTIFWGVILDSSEIS